LNPKGLRLYPGSVRIVQEIARRHGLELHGLELHAEVWDIDPEVARAWANYRNREGIASHRGDGFAGVLSLLARSPPGLLLIDPPYVDPKDASLAENLFSEAMERGWTVLWWSMMSLDIIPQSSRVERFSLGFAEAGMECGRWDGASMVLHGADPSLIERVRGQAAALIKVLNNYKNSFKGRY
jgi:23S rRNA A2030 N6-methylase RlmJ